MICNCSKCHRLIRECESSCDIEGGLCQECWEEYCAEMWWRTSWGTHEPIDREVIIDETHK